MYVNLFRIFCSFYFVGFSFFYYLKPHGIAQPEHIPFPWVASPRNGVPWIAQNRLKPPPSPQSETLLGVPGVSGAKKTMIYPPIISRFSDDL